jgi:MFS family permease
VRRWSSGEASLALAAITHTYLLFHCYPYLGYMAVELLHPVPTNTPITVDSAGWYAGLLGTAFSAGRYVSFIPWKRIQHLPAMSVKKTLMMSLILSSICSLWFGLSRSYIGALLARFCLGLSNALSGCVKRMTINQAKKDAVKLQQESNHENDQAGHRQVEMAPTVVLSVMMWGSALGPFVGGMLSNPGAYHEDTILPNPLEDRYPFFLPNLFGSLLCLVSLVGVTMFIPDERHEQMKMEPMRLFPPNDNLSCQPRHSARTTSGKLVTAYEINC